MVSVMSHYKSASGLDYSAQLALVTDALEREPRVDVSKDFVDQVASSEVGAANLEDIFFEAKDKVLRDSQAGKRPLFAPMVSEARFTDTAITMISQGKSGLKLAVGMP